MASRFDFSAVRSLAGVRFLVTFLGLFVGLFLPELANAQFFPTAGGDCPSCAALGLQGGGTPMNGALASNLQDFGRVLPHSGLLLGAAGGVNGVGGAGAYPMLPIQSAPQAYNGMPLQGGLFGGTSQLWIPGNPMPGSLLHQPGGLAAQFPNRFETPYFSAQNGGIIPQGQFAPWAAMEQFPVNPKVKLSTFPDGADFGGQSGPMSAVAY